MIRLITGNGGGYGDPRQRDRAAVAMEVKNGLLIPDRAPDRAREVHGWEG